MTGPVRAARRRPATVPAVLAAAGVGSLGWLAVLPAPADATTEPCVGVVVDARLLGGEVRTACAKGDPGSGLEALTMAGFGYAFVPRQPGLVCQVDEAPECSRTSTTTYWSYWSRARGSRTWVYSSAGAGANDPAPGSTEAWVWQEGGRREPPDVSLTSICPQLAAAPRTKTRDSPPSPRRSAGTATDASPDPRTTSKASATRRSTTAPAPASAPSSAPSSSAPTTQSVAPTGNRTGAAVADAAPSDPGPDRAPWAGLVLGGALVTTLGAAALARSRRSGGTR